MNTLIKSIILLFAAAAVVNCSNNQPKPKTQGVKSASQNAKSDKEKEDSKDKSEDEEDQEPEKRTKKDYGIIDLDDVTVSVSKSVELRESEMIPDLAFPALEIQYSDQRKGTEADYVQVIRCVASYRLKTPMGDSISKARKSNTARNDLRSAWKSAINSRSDCRYVGEYVRAGVYFDFAAKNGEFYYVINPCIGKEKSISNRAECSFDLQITDTVVFESGLEEQFRIKARELSQAESELNGKLGELKFIIDKFESNLKACEDLLAHERHMMSFKQGLVTMGFFVGFAALGYMLGGPNIAVMLGQMGGLMGAMFFMNMVLKWPMQIANVCLDPGFAGNAEGADGILSVTPLRDRMVALLSEEIPLATQRVQVVQGELAMLHEGVITYDQVVEQASSKGIDISDPTSNLANSAGVSIPGLGTLPNDIPQQN